MPVLSPLIQAWVQARDWKMRQASLMVIAQVAEGCRKVMLEDSALSSLMALCCNAATDSHSHVKWACCQAIGQICTGAALWQFHWNVLCTGDRYTKSHKESP